MIAASGGAGLPDIPGYVFAILGGIAFVSGMLIWFARRAEGRTDAGIGKFFDGRLIGVVGLMGFGKTSFTVATYIVPALRQGRRVITNFTVRDDDLPGEAILMRPETFGVDLIGIGSSLNVKDGKAMSGWFLDTACTCGKTGKEQLACSCNGAVLVIDESHSFLPASNSRPLPLDLLTWLTMARKNHLQIIWLTQYYKWVHAAVRRLTQDVYQTMPNGLKGHHLARLHTLDSSGNLSKEHTSEIRYNVMKIGDRYDTYEIIIPAATAYEISGELRKRSLMEAPPVKAPNPEVAAWAGAVEDLAHVLNGRPK